MDGKRKAGNPWWIAVVLLVFFLSYPLSLGPINGLANHGMLSPAVCEALEVFYSPMSLVLDNEIPWVTSLFEAYVDLWM